MKKKRRIVIFLLTMLLILTSVYPAPVSAAGNDIPGKVTLSKVSTSAYNLVNVQWKKASNVTKYVVYYRVSGNKKWIKIATVSASRTSYTHRSSSKSPIITGKKYDYTVRGYNSRSGKYGSYNTKGISVQIKPDKVKLSTAAVEKDGSVTVSWKAAGGADAYVVYRKNDKGKWEKIKTVKTVKTPGSAVSYKDKTPYKGVKNIYTVRSYNSKVKIYGSYDTNGVTTKTKVPSETTPVPNPTPTPTPAPDETDVYCAEVAELVNQEREKAGLLKLVDDPKLRQLACIRAKELETVFDHVRPDGSSCFTIFYENGVMFWSAGENIAWGQGNPAAVMNSWMNSPGHRANILSTDFGKIGVGYYKNSRGRKYWVQLFTD